MVMGHSEVPITNSAIRESGIWENDMERFVFPYILKLKITVYGIIRIRHLIVVFLSHTRCTSGLVDILN